MIFSLLLSVSDVLIYDGRDIYSTSVCLKAMVWIGWLLSGGGEEGGAWQREVGVLGGAGGVQSGAGSRPPPGPGPCGERGGGSQV